MPDPIVSFNNPIVPIDEAQFDSAAAQSAIAAADFADQAAAAAAAAAAALASLLTQLANYLPLAGGTMTGKINLDGAPSAALHAATKAYVDSLVAGRLPLTGGTLSGPLVLPGSPSLPDQAATKAYVDLIASLVTQLIYDVSFYAADVLGDGETLFRMVAGRQFTVEQNAPGSLAVAEVASTGNVTLDIQKNGVSVGGINFNASDSGTFTFPALETFAVGDILEIIAPSPDDPDLAGVSISLLGVR
jgi:hypothetical protein